jgi:hypothetical protein
MLHYADITAMRIDQLKTFRKVVEALTASGFLKEKSKAKIQLTTSKLKVSSLKSDLISWCAVEICLLEYVVFLHY